MQIIIQEHLKSEVQKMQHQCENDWQCGYQNALKDVLHIINSLTPIELPSNEEIKDKSFNNFAQSNARICFEEGAKWMKSKILGNNHLGGITY